MVDVASTDPSGGVVVANAPEALLPPPAPGPPPPTVQRVVVLALLAPAVLRGGFRDLPPLSSEAPEAEEMEVEEWRIVEGAFVQASKSLGSLKAPSSLPRKRWRFPARRSHNSYSPSAQ